MLELHKQILDLEEKIALTESKSIQLDREVVEMESDLDIAWSE